MLVQNRVSAAEPRLPEEVRRLGLQVRKASPDLMMVIHLTSPDGSRDQQYISNYTNLYVRDELLRIDGIGNATVFGARDYAMRIWLDPAQVAARSLTASEVVAACGRPTCRSRRAPSTSRRRHRPGRSNSPSRRSGA